MNFDLSRKAIKRSVGDSRTKTMTEPKEKIQDTLVEVSSVNSWEIHEDEDFDAIVAAFT